MTARGTERRGEAALRCGAHVHDNEAGALQHVGVVEALVALAVEAARARLRDPVTFPSPAPARRRLAALLVAGPSLAGRAGRSTRVDKQGTVLN